ncbi:MAG TPA: HAMP domain-containing sensor histidine kinase [Acidimicrobiia bacterium]|nr:HAMP domain-containing sensor histidine kinase [Acidimicrobiia bacterium]
MSAAGVSERVRARIPQTVRVRLSLFYALLFLTAGAALLGLTYGLVANSLPNPRSPSAFDKNQRAKLTAACKLASRSSSAVVVTGPKSGQAVAGAKPQLRPTSLPVACKDAFAAGANAATVDQRNQTLHNLLWFSLLGLGVITVGSGGLGWVMAGRVLRPVRTIADAARRASAQHLGERLALAGPQDELKDLADTFDDMLDRLDAAFASQRRFIADASHELRTPLTVMRTAVDVTLAKAAPSSEQFEHMAVKVRRSVDHAEALIDALLTLAISERALTTTELVDLATLVEDALDTAQPEIDRLDLHVDTALQPAETIADRLLLERLAANLIDNAVCHNNVGGWIRVETGTTNAGAYLNVINSGVVIADDVVESLFEPFRRIEERTTTRDGVGLGLAIVRSVAAAHHAHIEARSRPDGGLAISIVLPAPAKPD